MGGRPTGRNASDHRATFSGLLFRQHREHSGVGPHRKLDSLLALPIDSQFAVSTKQFGLDSVVNAVLGGAVVVISLTRLGVVPHPIHILLYLVAIGFGIAIHYSIMLNLAAISFWIVRAQGLVYGYFNFLNIARYPDVIFPRIFRLIFSWIIPVVIVANIPARVLIKSLGQPRPLMLQLVAASLIIFCFHAFSGVSRFSAIPAQVPRRKDLWGALNFPLHHCRFVLNYALSSRRQRAARFDFYGQVEEKSHPSQVEKPAARKPAKLAKKGCEASGRK